jgi:DNA mismatch repair protein MSH6
MKRENVKVAYVDPLLQYNKNLGLILNTVNGFQEMCLWSQEAQRHLQSALGGSVPALLTELLTTMSASEVAVKHILSLFDKKKAEKSGTILPSRGTVPEYDAACDSLQALDAKFQSELARVQDIFQDSSIAYCDLGKDLFLVEVPLSSIKKAKSVPAGAFVERTRTTKSIKYVVTSLEDDVEAHKKATAAKSLALVSVLRTIADHICQHIVVFHNAFSALSYLDCLFALASLRKCGAASTCVPRLDATAGSAFVEAEGAYHPLLSTAAGSSAASVVPNDITLSQKEGRLLVLTGPNMAGKSTLMRTVAINLLLAQLGGFVFAERFTFSPVTRIFTRIGARDAAHRGQSTLLVELSETSDILNFADGSSLCLIDELGRGTSTHDGYAIAHATLCHLTRHLSTGPSSSNSEAPASTGAPLVIFSTHYHALALEVQNSDRHSSGTQLGYMEFAITEPKLDAGSQTSSSVKDIVFLFRLVKGICTRSYGVEVAVKAGVERSLVEMAQKKSNELSQTILRHQTLQLLKDFVSLSTTSGSDENGSSAGCKEWFVRSSSLLALASH